jgi:hypothetical protein
MWEGKVRNGYEGYESQLISDEGEYIYAFETEKGHKLGFHKTTLRRICICS